MRVLILGGDGYLGWPTAMHMSAQGHYVAVVDNYLRRNLMRDENVEPLLSNLDLEDRVKNWNNKTGFFYCDQKCFGKWTSINQSGEKNPRFKDKIIICVNFFCIIKFCET